jgi:site-specific recombinase XerD
MNNSTQHPALFPRLHPEDPEVFSAFAEILVGRDPKTKAAYLATLRNLATWLASRPGAIPFKVELLTETAIQGYLDYLVVTNHAPRTRAKALSAIRRFCRFAIEEGLLRRNPVNHLERPTVVAMAPQELSEDQRFVLKTLVERHGSKRLEAIFALGYWAGLRISEIAALQMAQCEINQRTGIITIVNSKGGKTRTLDLHNTARRALYTYLYENKGANDARDSESKFVFTSQRSVWLRNHSQPDHLSPRGLQYLWSQLKTSANHEEWDLIREVNFHLLRHDWAHRARETGWSLEEIAVYAGHQTKNGTSAIATTARYTLPSRRQLRERLQILKG